MTAYNAAAADRILARIFDRAGNCASGLDLTPVGEDGHAVANLLWKISGYLKGRTKPSLTCTACRNWNHWHSTADGSCEDPRCECPYRPTG